MALPLTGRKVAVFCKIEKVTKTALVVSTENLDLPLGEKGAPRKQFTIPRSKGVEFGSERSDRVWMPENLAKAVGLI